MRDLSASQLIDLRNVVQGAEVELWEVDLTSMGGDVYRFCNEVNERGQSITWQGELYQAYPCQGDGFDWSGQGPSNRPKLVLANITGLVTGLCEDYEDLAGALVTRRLVEAKALDAVNFLNGNPTADPSRELMVARYLVERLTDLIADIAVFELALPSETDTLLIPARVALTNSCSWVYRESDCGYTGGPVADAKDQTTSDPAQDRCGKRLASCKLRWGANAPLPFGGFPTANKLG
ncbi:phage minor tail protein L [Oceanisphaera sediminis]|uniref:Phage minor tail protein L n=1 Tax=Oceanisphaera sediminis TaxID=981381 RepID=A0ABP7DHI1_9GAMM